MQHCNLVHWTSRELINRMLPSFNWTGKGGEEAATRGVAWLWKWGNESSGEGREKA